MRASASGPVVLGVIVIALLSAACVCMSDTYPGANLTSSTRTYSLANTSLCFGS